MSNKSIQLITPNSITANVNNSEIVGSKFDRIVSMFLLVIISPLLVCNVLFAKIKNKPILKTVQTKDCLNRMVQHYKFTSGLFKNSLILYAVFRQQLALCGMPIGLTLSQDQKNKLRNYNFILPGLFNAVRLHRSTGLTSQDSVTLLQEQFSYSISRYISLLARCIISRFIYSSKTKSLATPAKFSLFGLEINNVSMQQAVSWVVENRESNLKCKIGCFANVNSVNLAAKHKQLVTNINSADRCFADGSGLRLAAKKIGINIKENVNGTDMLPHLCKAAVHEGLSIYLLGGSEDVALKTANNLRNQFPGLRIAGAHHGYFPQHKTSHITEAINKSNADILLLAMGSPVQEEWLNKQASLLKCRTALAVGGLFDFYSGKIPRAPMWMRELGLEWIWRLMQEPRTKFNRYVIGNPLFLFRTFVLNQANRGL
ncbi:WecB/TagA/CpsF family glycosyltransferase [Paraglaciecola aquimarina]|uniref:WecB/TagA/CpsF family glycosyltransferase n=1 Tax=Paraglaciecola algarum TaxID=3050085 RepID=A0ABS9DC50_9ALTE|nr:WecB/TagA/CpsF family glycosyltransferase [Paraglaciecola sp. G1-23]MCF2950425.1 WecB/TagA/CpsF family glycosyltransferase [Paraglaciecola sp. G1-23]